MSAGLRGGDELALHMCVVLGDCGVEGSVRTGLCAFSSLVAFFSSFPILLVFNVGGLGFELCVFIAGWRHALQSEWPFIMNYLYYY